MSRMCSCFRFLIIPVLILGSFTWSKSQDIESAADSLAKIAPLILNGPTDSIREHANRTFIKDLHKILRKPGAFEYPFTELKTIARLMPEDKSFRIFNWNMPLDNGQYRYFGIVHQKVSNDSSRIIILEDGSGKLTEPQLQELPPQSWYGAHYYRIIQHEANEITYYTLLGWDGYNPRITRKLIDVLWFDKKGNPRFGATLFKQYHKGNHRRVIFNYSGEATMGLKYETELELPVKHRALFGTKMGTFRAIVFDQLVPLYQGMENDYRYYVPESSQYNAFLLKNGYWVFHSDIPLKISEERQRPRNRKKKPDEGLFPPE